MSVYHRLIGNQLWQYKDGYGVGHIIANGVPPTITTVEHALQWVEDNGRNGYKELMAKVEEYRVKADDTQDKDQRKAYLELAHEALERAEGEL